MRIYTNNQILNEINKYRLNDYFFNTRSDRSYMSPMKTDIIENENGYNFTVEVPGCTKDDVTIDLENGYLKISTVIGEDQAEDEKLVLKERIAVKSTRTFFVGEKFAPENVSAVIENGLLKINLTKPEEKEITNTRILIS